MRESGKILAHTLELIRKEIRPGISTKYLDKIANDYIISCGGKPSFLRLYGFPASICSSIDDIVVHGIPRESDIFKEGQIIGVDCGVKYKGFHTDAARTFAVGEISDEKKKLIEVTEASFFEGIKDLKANDRVGDIGARVQNYVEKHGFSDMRSTYHMKQGGVMTINFAATQGDVLLYPDLVKVSVALDDGSIIGLETRGYLMNHRTRTLPQAEISVEEAKSKVADGLEILGHKLCVIPREGGQEVFCHEFVCQTERGEHYIVYVDAVSGEQEKILILLEDETGAQTI